MVSIVAFQAVDPGSIPGRRTFYVVAGTLEYHFWCARDGQVILHQEPLEDL